MYFLMSIIDKMLIVCQQVVIINMSQEKLQKLSEVMGKRRIKKVYTMSREIYRAIQLMSRRET